MCYIHSHLLVSLASHTIKPTVFPWSGNVFFPFLFKMYVLDGCVTISIWEALSRRWWRERWTNRLSCSWIFFPHLVLYCAFIQDIRLVQLVETLSGLSQPLILILSECHVSAELSLQWNTKPCGPGLIHYHILLSRCVLPYSVLWQCSQRLLQWPPLPVCFETVTATGAVFTKTASLQGAYISPVVLTVCVWLLRHPKSLNALSSVCVCV